MISDISVSSKFNKIIELTYSQTKSKHVLRPTPVTSTYICWNLMLPSVPFAKPNVNRAVAMA